VVLAPVGMLVMGKGANPAVAVKVTHVLLVSRKNSVPKCEINDV